MQQINLYQEQFKKRKVPLSGVSLCLILIISVAALTVVQLFSQQALGPMRRSRLKCRCKWRI